MGLMGTPVERTADILVPFKATLYRCSLPGPGRLSITHLVGPIDDLRTIRIQRACQQKFLSSPSGKLGGPNRFDS
jgi:hypothetical protein